MAGDLPDPAKVDVTEGAPQDHTREVFDLRPSPRSFDVTPFDPVRHRAQAQLRVTYFLLGIVAGTIVAAFGARLFFGIPVDDLDTLLKLILTPLLTLLGTAIGFYFGRSD